MLPTPNDSIQGVRAVPKEMCHRDTWDNLQCTDYKIREHRINRDASLLGVKEQLAPGEPVSCELDCVTDTHTAIPEQEHQRTQTAGTIFTAGCDLIVEGIQPRQDTHHL